MKKLNDLSQLASLKEEMVKEEWKDYNSNTTQIDEEELNVIESRNSSYDYIDSIDEMVQRGRLFKNL